MLKYGFSIFLAIVIVLSMSLGIDAQTKSKPRKSSKVSKIEVKSKNDPIISTGGMISLAFDDNHFSQIFALPYMSEHNFKGTLYITVKPINDEYRDYHYGITYLKLFASHGWQIANHGYDHEGFPLISMAGSERIFEDIFVAHEHLVMAGFKNINSFAPPYSKLSQALYDIVKNRTSYSSLRHVYDPSTCKTKGCVNGLNEIVPKNFYDLCSIDIGPSPKPFYAHDLFELVLKAKKENKWLIITFHKFASRDAKAENYEMLESEFKVLLDFLSKNNMKIVTIDEGIKSISK